MTTHTCKDTRNMEYLLIVGLKNDTATIEITVEFPQESEN